MASSDMRTTMERQPADLERLAADTGPSEAAADRLAGRRVFLVGTGTSWHAANHGEWLLRLAGVDARAVQAIDAALWGPAPGSGDALLLLSHTGAKRYANDVLERASAQGTPCVRIGAVGTGADVETVEKETSSAYTASHLATLMRLAQITVALGGEVGDLGAVPGAMRAAIDGPGPGVEPPGRLIEYVGAGANQWTAAEGALKVREAALLASEGLGVEQLLHGPLVALGSDDALVALDGGGPASERLAQVAGLAEADGARVHRVSETALGEPLSVFPLTVAVQRVALECAEKLGSNPDSFGYHVPGREATWEKVPL
jgi:glucosamine--fructose-6-phosphate aminotransferase (isomerizing)